MHEHQRHWPQWTTPASDRTERPDSIETLPKLVVSEDGSLRVVPSRELVIAPPRVDDDGLLWFSRSWVAISDAQLPLIRLFVRQFERIVRDDALIEAYGTTAEASALNVRGAIHRLGRRVQRVGLVLRRVHGRGYVLSIRNPMPA